MMNNPELFWCIVAMGLVTYIPRVLPLILFSKMKIPENLELWLKYIPTSVLGALIFSEIFLNGKKISINYTNPNLVTSIIVFIIAYRTKSLAFTICGGMLIFWLLKELVFK